MHFHKFFAISISSIALFNIAFAHADTQTNAGPGKKPLPEQNKSYWSGQFELGYNNQSGNTNSEMLHSALQLIYDKTLWKNTLKLQADNQYSNNQHTAEEYQASDQIDLSIDAQQYVFGRVNYDKNRFSGYDYQSSATGGYGYKVLNGPVNFLSFEAGAGYTYNRTQDAKTQSGIAGRVAGNYLWHISDLTQFAQNMQLETGAGNNKITSSTSLETSITGPLHLKLAYLITYNSKVPATYKHTDKQLVASVIYKF